MNVETIDTLAKRIACLERENRRWKWIVGNVGVTALSLVVFSCAASVMVRDEVRTKRIVVVDNQGNRRIELGKAKDEEKFAVTLLTPNGTVAAEMYETEVFGIHAGIGLNSIKGEPRVDLSTSSAASFDSSKLRLAGDNHVIPNTGGMEQSPESIELAVRNSRAPQDPKIKIEPSTASLALRSGLNGASFWLDSHQSELRFYNYEAPPPAAILASDKGTFQLGFYDGEPSLTLGDDAFGTPGLVLGHTRLKARATGTVEQRSAASLVMFDKDGKVILSQPR